MKPNQNLHNLTGEIINGIKDVLGEFKADYVLVQQDTCIGVRVHHLFRIKNMSC